ncbi:MAG: cytochrome c biogenesis protein CcdA [Candidatus Thorarchaeota archaeon]
MQGIIEITSLLTAALFSGLYVAMSPCLFPLLPLYLMRSLNSADSVRRSLIVTIVLVLGILTSIAFFAVVAGLIGTFLIQHFTQIQVILGFILIFLGILTASKSLREKLRITSMSVSSQPTTPTGLVSVYMVGLGYSLLAAPCVWPTLTATFLLFGTQANLVVLLLMFLIISIAVASPYIAIAVVTGEARTRLTMSMAKHSRKIEIAAGALLIFIGIVLILPIFQITLLY